MTDKENPFDNDSWENLTYQFDYFDCVYENLYYLDKDKRRVITNTGKVLKKSSDSEQYNFFDYYRDHFQDYYFDNLEKPHLIVVCIGTIFSLDHIVYDEETVKYLNDKGLEIYLWDNLFISNTVDKKVLSIDGHGSHLPPEMRVKPEEVIFNFDQNNIPNFLYSFELESIKQFIKKHNLKKVTVYSNEYETDKIFNSLYPEFEIRGANIFVMTYRRTVGASEEHLRSSLMVEHIKEKFLSLSLRYEIHRHIVTAYIIDKSSIISWASNGRDWKKMKYPTLEHLNEETPFDFAAWEFKYPELYKKISKGNQVLQQRTPIRLESEKYLDDIECGCRVPFPLSSHAAVFCQLVTETTYGQPFPSYSEKIINAIVCLRPFIMIGPAYNLKYLKMMGFKTFDRWWDESYDQEEDHEKRIIKILELIDYIDSFSIDELKSMYVEMKEILEHNYNLTKILKEKPLIV